MGIIYSRAIRQIKRFNVENRALRAIDRKQPVTAPKHLTSKKLFEKVMKETPEVKLKLIEKDTRLDSFLKDVYVKSSVMTPPVTRDTSLLPKERKPMPDEEFGFKLPAREEIPVGQVNLKDALRFIADHNTQPDYWTAATIASSYSIEEQTVNLDICNSFLTVWIRNFWFFPSRWAPLRQKRFVVDDVLEHFRTFHVHISGAKLDSRGIYDLKRIAEDPMKNILPDKNENFTDHPLSKTTSSKT